MPILSRTGIKINRAYEIPRYISALRCTDSNIITMVAGGGANCGLYYGSNGFNCSNGVIVNNTIDGGAVSNDGLTLHDGGSHNGCTNFFIGFNYVIGGLENSVDIGGEYDDVTIMGNTIIGGPSQAINYASLVISDAGGTAKPVGVFVIGNTISQHATSKGFGIEAKGTSHIYGNLVTCGNLYAGSNIASGIRIDRAGCTLENNTFIGSAAPVVSLTIIRLVTGITDAVIRNNLVISRTNDSQLIWGNTAADVYACTIDGNYWVITASQSVNPW